MLFKGQMYTYRVEYDSARKRKEIWPFVTHGWARRALQSARPSEIRQTETKTV